MGVAVATIRQAVASAISTALGASGWRESPQAFDLFGDMEGGQRYHLGYAVGTPSTDIVSATDRQRVSEGAYVHTDLRIRYSYRLGAQKEITDYDAALAAEASIMDALAGIQATGGYHLTYQGATREVQQDGFVLGELRYQAAHLLALT